MHSERANAVRILETAFDAGITHFDVARLYGFGQAEGILGEFLRNKRDKVTVATKFGLEASGSMAKSRKLVSIARWLAHRSKFIAKFARRASSNAISAGKFNPTDAQASLTTSLRELGTDHIDLFLLHECTIANAQQPDLIAFLEAQVAKGTIRAFGPSSGFAKLGDDAAAYPATCSILQFDSNTLEPNIEKLRNRDLRMCITFGPIQGAGKLASLVKASPEAAAPFETLLGAPLSNPDVLAGFLLRDALARNNDGIVLFASTKPQRVTANIATATTIQSPPEHIEVFREFVRAVSRP